MRPILYYVHHQGQGHWRRALAVAEQLDRPVVLASSSAPPRRLAPSCRYLPLPLDYSAGQDHTGNDANGQLHWAPPHHDGLLQRHQILLEAAERYRPPLAVVDVSVEVTVLLRTSGIPVVAVRQPGERVDPAHELGFGLADEVIMPVPPEWNLHQGLPRTRAVGFVSGTHLPSLKTNNGGRLRAVVVVGSGGSRLDSGRCAQIASELPDHDVHVLGLAGRSVGNLVYRGQVEDARGDLGEASVVIGNAGLGTVGEVLTAGKPFVVVPEERPFGEQDATAAALEATGAAVVLHHLPEPGGWARAVQKATAPPPVASDGAQAFAHLLEERAGLTDPLPERPRVPVGAA